MIAVRRSAVPSLSARPARRAAGIFLLGISLLWGAACASRPTEVFIREDFPFDPREELPPPFPRHVEKGWKALAEGNAARALEHFGRAPVDAAAPAAAIGRVESALLADRNAQALALCEELLPSAPRTVPLLASCAEATARGGDRRAGLALYREALAKAPSRRGLRSRTDDLLVTAREELLRSAEAKASAGEPEPARALFREAAELDPHSSRVRAQAAAFELQAGNRPEALGLYRAALDRDPASRALQERVAELSLHEGDAALAVSLYEDLGRADPAFAEKAAEARIAFRVQNWPGPEQEAARAARLTRAQAASLVWWSVPEVRDAQVTSGVIASDILGRPDRRALARMLALGLLEADANHRARPDAPLTAPAGARLSLRLMAMLRSGRAPLACLKDRPVRRAGQAMRAALDCGIPLPASGAVSGRDMLRALERVRALSNGEGAS